MSGPKGINYELQLAAQQEARDLAVQRSRLEVALRERASVLEECAALQRVYDETVTPIDVPAAASAEDSGALRARVDRILADTLVTRGEVDAVRSRRRREGLAARLRELGPTILPSAPSEEADDVEGIVERAERYIAQLDPGVEITEELAALASRLQANTSSTVELAVRDVQDEVARLNRDHRRSVAVTRALGELEARASVLENSAPKKAIARASTRAAVVLDDELLALGEQLAAAEAAEESERNRGYVTQTVSGILTDLHYEVVTGFETVVAEGGVLVRKPGWRHHALLLAVDDDEVGLRVVRTATEDDSKVSKRRDLEAEEEWCTDLPQIVDDIGKHGIQVGAVRRISPGVKAVAVLDGARRASEETTQAEQPRAREL